MTEEKKDDVKKEDADKAFDNEQMLDLSHDELYNIMAKRPQVQGRKAMDVLLKWAKKQFALEAPKVEKKEEVVEKEEKKVEEVKDVEGTKYDTKKVLSSHGLSLKASMESDKDDKNGSIASNSEKLNGNSEKRDSR